MTIEIKGFGTITASADDLVNLADALFHASDWYYTATQMEDDKELVKGMKWCDKMEQKLCKALEKATKEK